MEEFRVVFVGAGGINFGSPEGPWNHSERLERVLGHRLRVVALVDPDAKRRALVLSAKHASPTSAASYTNVSEFSSVEELVQACLSSTAPLDQQPHLIVLGVPPARHGSPKPGLDMELQLIRTMPKAHLFCEKPMSASPVDDVLALGLKMGELASQVSVGYFMRQLAAVKKAKSIIAENKLRVMAINARYNCAYTSVAKSDWWHKSISCGPIVEQGTHFCDLARHFGGDVVLDSVRAHAVQHNEPPGQLSAIPVDEQSIQADDRIPRATAACWKFESGAVCTLLHSLNLHGSNYATSFEILTDGYLLRLTRLYDRPTLIVRSPSTGLDDDQQVFEFPHDDPYLTQMEAVVEGASTGAPPVSASGEPALSDWQDAAKTYALTWRIRHESERANK